MSSRCASPCASFEVFAHAERGRRTEDPVTVWAKARYAFQRRLAGVTVFDISGDYQGTLANQIRNGLNINKGVSPPVAAKLKRHLEKRKLHSTV